MMINPNLSKLAQHIQQSRGAKEVDDACRARTPAAEPTQTATPVAAKSEVSGEAQAGARNLNAALERCLGARFQTMEFIPGRDNGGMINVGYKPNVKTK